MAESDYTVRYTDLPPTIPALTAKDANGHYNIYINGRLSVDTQKRALLHELRHVELNDFDADTPFSTVEPYRRAESDEEAVGAKIETKAEQTILPLKRPDSAAGTSQPRVITYYLNMSRAVLDIWPTEEELKRHRA